MASDRNNGKLSLDCLGQVLEELYDANCKWYSIGLQLQIKTACLDRIKENCSRDTSECFREMLKEWLKTSEDCEWAILVAALRTRSVREYSLAKRLEQEYVLQLNKEKEVQCNSSKAKPKEYSSGTTSEGVSSLKGKFSTYIELSGSELPTPTSHSGSLSSSTGASANTDGGKNRAYGCLCGKCSLNTFLDGMCPNTEKTATSFPYLKVSSLTESEKMILRGRLFEDFCQISIEFSKFNTAVCESLVDRKIPVVRVTRILRDLRAFSPSLSNTPLLGTQIDDISPEKTIDDIFDILSHYVSFFNFQLTEYLVNSLGTSQDKDLLHRYRAKLDEYCNRNIFECPSYSAPHPEQAALVMKVEGIEQYNMKHLSKLISYVSRALSVSYYSLRLCSVEEGCTKLNFQVPEFVRDVIFPLKTEYIEGLMGIERGLKKPFQISLVKCGFYLYKIPLTTYQTMKEKVVAKKDCIYNHGELSRADAEALLSSLDYNCFLVRQSSNAVGCLVYSYKDYGHFNHVKKEETIDLDFVHSTQESACLMPIHLKDKVVTAPDEQYLDAMSDYGSDLERDCTGESSDDFSGTGDSAIVWRSALPEANTPHHRHSYEKLDPKSFNKRSTYSKLETINQ